MTAADLLRRLANRLPARAGIPRGARVRRLSEDTWLAESGPARKYRPLGEDTAHSALLVDVPRMRQHYWDFERPLLRYVATEHVARLLRELRINCVLDVGANAGQYAKTLRRHGFTGRIVSFEPVAEFFAELEAAAADDPDWLVRPCALGEEDAVTEINATPGKKMSSLLPASEFGAGYSSALATPTAEQVTVRRLDGLLDEVTAGIDRPRLYLKLDTQGFDLPAFRGAGDRIREIRAMQSEVACIPLYDGMARLPEQLAAYESAGFEMAGMFPVTRHKRTRRVIEFDMTLVRSDAKQDE